MPKSAVDALLDLRGLEAGDGKIGVLQGVDLTNGRGEVVTLLGPNGAGKITLLRAISGLESVAGLHGFKLLVDAGALDIAQPSVTKNGGIDEMLHMITHCQAHGVAVMPHSPYFGSGFIVTIHIIAALIEVRWLEMEANPFDPSVRTRNGRRKVLIFQNSRLAAATRPKALRRYQDRQRRQHSHR